MYFSLWSLDVIWFVRDGSETFSSSEEVEEYETRPRSCLFNLLKTTNTIMAKRPLVKTGISEMGLTSESIAVEMGATGLPAKRELCFVLQL